MSGRVSTIFFLSKLFLTFFKQTLTIQSFKKKNLNLSQAQ
jgi:hypothetical protein